MPAHRHDHGSARARQNATHRLNGFRLAHERRAWPVDKDLLRRPRRLQPGVRARRSPRGPRHPSPRRPVRRQRRDGARRDAGVPGGRRAPDPRGRRRGRVRRDVQDEQVEPSLTTAHQPFAEMARATVGELLARIEGEPPTGLRLIEPDLFLGQSSARPRPGAERPTGTMLARRRPTRSAGERDLPGRSPQHAFCSQPDQHTKENDNMLRIPGAQPPRPQVRPSAAPVPCSSHRCSPPGCSPAPRA